jgi:dTDP-4-amino-4,6-dideoxygalactose transaminase
MQYGRHNINDADIEAVVRVLKSDYITSGPEVPLFEKNISEFCGVKYGVAVNSGSSALECALSAINVRGYKVVVPNITFVATVNAVTNQGGEVVLCDVTDSGHIDVDALGRLLYGSENIIAVISVDFAGIPCDYDKINALCVRHNILHISDAAHSLGAFYKSNQSGKVEPVGSLADITCFSFHPVKTITTAEGGMCVTDNRNVAAHMRMYRSHGVDIPVERRMNYKYDVLYSGHNYRMNEIQAALGNSQFKRMSDFLVKRNELSYRYITNIKENVKLRTFVRPTIDIVNTYKFVSSWHIFTVLVKNRDKVYFGMRDMGINCNVHYLPISDTTAYRTYNSNLDNSNEVAAQLLTLPLHYSMTLNDVDIVCAKLSSLL